MGKRTLQNISDIVIDGNSVWIITDTLNCLFKYDLYSKELELVSEFPEMMQSDFAPFNKMVMVANEIYFIPRMAKDIFYYNLFEKKFYELHAPLDDFQEDKRMSIVVDGKMIYCINRFPDAIIKIDSETKEISKYYADIGAQTDKMIESKIYRSYRSLCFHDGKIIWSNYNKVLTIFDIDKEMFSTEFLEDFPCEKIVNSKDIFGLELNDWIVNVKVIKDILCLCTYKDKIYLYGKEGLQKVDNVLFDRCIESCNKAHITREASCIFREIVVLKDEVWFIPTYRNKCIVYDYNMDQFREELDTYIEDWNVDRREYSIYKVLSDGKILLYSYFENLFTIINTEVNSVKSLEKIEYSAEKFIKQSRILERLLIRNNYMPFDDLQFLINRVGYMDELIEKKALEHNDIGRGIFDALQ